MKKVSDTDVFYTRLTNGLEVLLKEDRTAPIASIWTWYRVGSRNEVPGKTGLSHWVEHMQFKGTPRIAKGQIFRDVSRVGGTLNALTSHDWTAYFETVPFEHIDLPLTIEADRMVNSLFATDEVESERTVILSERQGAENNPGYALYEEVTGTAFQSHPYRHMVIGHEVDLRRITRDDLYDHYRRYYHPANAFIVAVGDFDAKDLVQRIDAHFGPIPSGPDQPRDIGIVEPSQPGVRRVLMRKPSGVPYLRMAFHAPRAANRDLVPLLVTEAVLSGGPPMGFGGGGAMGRSSRLYRSLVAAGLARAAGSDMSITIDPYLFQIGVTALPGGDLARIEAVVDQEIERLRSEPVPPDELERAVRQLEAQFVYSSEGVTNQAYWLGQWDIVDSWRRADTFLQEIRAVTADDIQRVAREHLDPDRRTVGWLEPVAGPGGGAGDLPDEQLPCWRPEPWGLDGSRSVAVDERGFQRIELGNGIAVLGQDRPGSRSVVLRLRLPAGSVYEAADEPGIAHLAARASLRGSGNQTFEEINARTDELGSSISVDSGRQFVEARVRCLSDDFPEMTRLLAQTVVTPSYPPDEVEKLKAEQLGAIAETDNDTRSTADRLLRRAIYPAPNPLGRRVLGERESVLRFDADVVRKYHARAFGPSGASIAVVGGIHGFDRAADIVADAFGNWNAGGPEREVLDFTPTNSGVRRETATIAGKSQADIAIGIATIPRNDPDYYALDVANLILGRLGLMGRLGAEVRDRQGLAYYVFSQVEPRLDGSLWSARAGVAPGNVDRAIDAIERELERLRSELVTEEELADAKSYLVGVLPLALETQDGVAATLLAIEEFGLGLDYLSRYPKIISGITREQVREAAERHLDAARRAITVAMPG